MCRAIIEASQPILAGGETLLLIGLGLITSLIAFLVLLLESVRNLPNKIYRNLLRGNRCHAPANRLRGLPAAASIPDSLVLVLVTLVVIGGPYSWQSGLYGGNVEQ